MDILNYHVKEMIYKGSHSVVYRAVDDEEEKHVILKLPAEIPSTVNEIALMKREKDIVSILDIRNIMNIQDFQWHENVPVFIIEDIGGKSLQSILVEKSFSITETIEIALKIIEILDNIHQRGVIHLDINPGNIIFNESSKELQIIDFGIASNLNKDSINTEKKLRGTLPYISPEQTGRMNRYIDYRTDYYSFGIMLYEMFTGYNPFQAKDTMEWVYSHLTASPRPPHEIKPALPLMLSKIILKLTEKLPENRYQSAKGIKQDLFYCLTQLKKNGRVNYRELAQFESISHFQISQKYYGRKKELKNMEKIVNEVFYGALKLIYIEGPAGIGKTSFAQQIHQIKNVNKMLVIKERFNPVNKNLPFNAIIKIIKSLVIKLLTLDQKEILDWKKRIILGVGKNGKILTDAVPELKYIIGEQSEIPELAPEETKNRFEIVVHSFIKVFAQSSQPLILFIDDIQYGDLSSIKLITSILLDNTLSYFCLIFAYRDNELKKNPQLYPFLESPEYKKYKEKITLKKLENEDIQQLLKDTLQNDSDKTSELTNICIKKTNGNPFFLHQFLYSLNKNNCFYLDNSSKKWKWKISKIKNSKITENVVELLKNKIQNLSPEIQDILKTASCLGNIFDLKFLQLINEKSRSENASLLLSAYKEGFIFPLEYNYQLTNYLSQINVQYEFVHDRILQACQELFKPAEKTKLHYKIGKILIKNLTSDEINDNLYDVVFHLNKGHRYIRNSDERYQISFLNYKAGINALSSVAYDSAYEYFIHAINFAGKDKWSEYYFYTKNLYISAAESAYINGKYNKMEKLASELIHHSIFTIDKAKISIVLMQAYIGQKNYKKAIDKGIEILAEFDLHFHHKQNIIILLKDLFIFKLKMSVIKREGEIYKKTESREIEFITNILLLISKSCYVGNIELLPNLVLKTALLSMKEGFSKYSANSFCMISVIFAGFLNNPKYGYFLSRFAMKIVDDLNAQEYRPFIYTISANFIYHWKYNIREMLNPLLDNYLLALEVGDIEAVSMNVQNYLFFSFIAGIDLCLLAEEFNKYEDLLIRLRIGGMLNFFHNNRQAVENLLGHSDDPLIFTGEFMDEAKIIEESIKKQDNNMLCSIYITKLMLYNIFVENKNLLEMIKKSEKYQKYAPGTMMIPLSTFHVTIAYCRYIRYANNQKSRNILIQIDRNIKKMKKWSKSGPDNYIHRYHLMKAERFRISKKYYQAQSHYEKAIYYASKNGFIQDEAMINEITSGFFLEIGNQKLYTSFLKDAYQCYLRWNATAKIDQLENKYCNILRTRINVEPHKTTTMGVNYYTDSTSRFDNLDFISILKASQIISGEIKLDKLLYNMMRISMQNAGAEHAVLILEKKGKYYVEAESFSEKDSFRLLDSTLLGKLNNNGFPFVPESICRYVIRTGEFINIDTSKNKIFNNDLYIQTYKPKSILSIPLVNQGNIVGVLYLDNKIISNTFNNESMLVMNLLSSQMAISIQNARNYNEIDYLNKNLELKVKKRTQELEKQKNILQQHKEDIDKELDMARKIQQNLIPTQAPNKSFSFYYKPMYQIGGDLFDFIEFEKSNKIGIFLSDVSGHGVPAALVTSLIKSFLLQFQSTNIILEPDKLLSVLNELLVNKTGGNFITAFYGIYDPAENNLCFSNAGHNPPYLIYHDSIEELTHPYPSPPLVVLTNEELINMGKIYKKHTISLQKGSKILFYTDGLTEATPFENNKSKIKNKKEDFGTHKLHEILKNNKNIPSNKMKNSIVESLIKYHGSDNFSDDVCIICADID